MQEAANSQKLQELKSAVERYAIAVQAEPVQLASGGWSNYYADVRVLTLHPRYAQLIGEFMAPAVIASGAEAIGGMAMGCIALASAISAAVLERGVTLPTFFVRPQPKEHGPSGKSAISQSAAAYGERDDSPLVRPGRKVAVVEDTVTQGGSALKAVEAIQAEGCEVVLVMSVVERHEGGGRLFRERGIGFKQLFYTDDQGVVYVDAEIAAAAG
ncbi:MAG TPA: phosphoribosyltransferase family protein [Dehalococcoidia bacterium]|nr:phosphoribosyltransferase family protein [Dehalococcoidia bacterium]